MPGVAPSDGPVAVTGASGYVGAHVVAALLRHGYDVHACVTDEANPEKTAHLRAMNDAGHPGRVTIHQANLLAPGSYDAPFAGCAALCHAGTAMAYGGANTPQQVYDAAVEGTKHVVASAARAATVRRIVYTSSYAAIGHPARSGYRFTESDWASDGRENDPGWSLDNLNDTGETGYAMAKEATERWLYEAAGADAGFDAVSINPIVVLGPLLAPVHHLVFSWQWFLGRMLRGKECARGWQHLWNVVDVRDVGEAQALAVASDRCGTGDRYLLAATDGSAELDCLELQAHLQRLFPEVAVGGAPDGLQAILDKHGQVFQAPVARCDRARRELGLETHAIDDTLRETGQSMIDLGCIEPKRR